MSDLLKDGAFRAIRFGVRWAEPVALQKFQQWSKLIDLVHRLNVNVFVDVGAKICGNYSRQLRVAGYRGLLISFEPNPDDCNSVRRLARGDAKWLVQDCALGDTEEQMNFHINSYNGQTTMSSLLALKDNPQNGKTISVKVSRLDNILSGMITSIKSPRIFLKLDTQGYDKRAFDGASGSLDTIIAMQSELSVMPLYNGAPHFTELLAHYETAGFQLMDLFAVNRTKDGRIVEYDCLMAKPSAFPVVDSRYL